MDSSAPAVLSFRLTGSQQRDLALDVELCVTPGQRLALIGPNGAGKTTVLRLLAGLEIAAPGSIIRSGETVLTDDSRHVPARHRHLPVAFAEPRLFPNLSVLENLTFAITGGRRSTGVEVTRALESLVALGIDGLAQRSAGELSSGQSAIVAVLRATLAAPVGVLLDEPFSALDANNAAAARTAVHHRLDSLDVPLVMATHSPLDVMTLATHVAVIEDGKLSQHGPVLNVANQPRTIFVASFLGLNLLSGVSDGTDVTIAEGGRTLSLQTVSPSHGPVWIAFAPHAVTISDKEPHGSARNSWQTTVYAMEQLGSIVRVEVRDPVSMRIDVTPAAIISLGLRPGTPAWVSLKATGIEVYPS